MRTTIIVAAAALVLTGLAALAQGQGEGAGARPAVGIGSKGMEVCAADRQKVCASAPGALAKECLVRNWTRITSDCQDALGTPISRLGGGGGG